MLPSTASPSPALAACWHGGARVGTCGGSPEESEDARPPEAVRESDSDGSEMPECDGDGDSRSAAPARALSRSAAAAAPASPADPGQPGPALAWPCSNLAAWSPASASVRLAGGKGRREARQQGGRTIAGGRGQQRGAAPGAADVGLALRAPATHTLGHRRAAWCSSQWLRPAHPSATACMPRALQAHQNDICPQYGAGPAHRPRQRARARAPPARARPGPARPRPRARACPWAPPACT